MLQNYLADVKRWALHPYREDGNALDWLLFIGLLTAATFLWSRVIRRIVTEL
jgi:hypothetical protein